MNNAIIGQLTDRKENEIKEVREFYAVYFVLFKSGRPTFVSRVRCFESAARAKGHWFSPINL